MLSFLYSISYVQVSKRSFFALLRATSNHFKPNRVIMPPGTAAWSLDGANWPSGWVM